MTIHRHGSRAVAAASIIANEPSVIIRARVQANSVLELRDESECGETVAAGGARADDALGGDVGDRRGEAFKGEGVLAGAAGEVKAGTGFEADGVWDLGF